MSHEEGMSGEAVICRIEWEGLVADVGGTVWTSLECAKLVVSGVTPLLVLVFGVVINNAIRSGERSSALRSEIYKAISGDLNDIYCYLSFVGGWKDLTPMDMVARKRAVDKAMFTYRPFFSVELFATYDRFMAAAFEPYAGAGKDARIRSDLVTPDGDRRKHGKYRWKREWEGRFTKERNKDAQRLAYTDFLKQMARDLSV